MKEARRQFAFEVLINRLMQARSLLQGLDGAVCADAEAAPQNSNHRAELLHVSFALVDIRSAVADCIALSRQLAGWPAEPIEEILEWQGLPKIERGPT
jgi:hypothetical protein